MKTSKVPTVPGVYVIVCLGNCKCYVGSSSRSVKDRMRVHRRLLEGNKHWNPYLQRSWNKYGEESFVFKVLEKCSPKDCLKREQYWIDKKKSYDPKIGFNVCRYSSSTTGRVLNESSIRSIREKLTGRKLSPEHVQKLKEADRTWRHSEETKKKIGKGRLGKYHSEESKKAVSDTKIKNSHLSREKRIMIRKEFISGHPKFGVPALAKRYGMSNGGMRRIVTSVNNVESGPVETDVSGT